MAPGSEVMVNEKPKVKNHPAVRGSPVFFVGVFLFALGLALVYFLRGTDAPSSYQVTNWTFTPYLIAAAALFGLIGLYRENYWIFTPALFVAAFSGLIFLAGGNAWIFLPALVTAAFGLALPLSVRWLSNRRTTYLVTGRSVRLEKGWPIKQTTELLLTQVGEVEIHQTGVEWLFRLGTVTVRTLDDPEGELRLERVSNPHGMSRAISGRSA